MKTRSTFALVIGIGLLVHQASAQASLVSDIFPGVATSSLSQFTPVGNKLLFTANNPSWGINPYMTDGTQPGTVILTNVSQPRGYTNVNGTIWFFADDAQESKHLWRSDGTQEGTYEMKLVLDKSYMTDPDLITPYNGGFVFRAHNQLWKSDGTAAGTVMIRDSVLDRSIDNSFVNLGGKLLFKGISGAEGTELWITDGTPEGTMMLKDIQTGNNSGMDAVYFGTAPLNRLVRSGNAVYFRADDGIHGSELWKTDGTAAGTVMVSDIHPTASSGIRDLADLDGTLYFVADDGTHGIELWKTTASGAALVLEIAPGSGDADINGITVMNHQLYFQAADGVSGYQLWRSNGTAAGTSIVKVIHPGGSASISNLRAENGLLYFSADDGTHGKEPWRSNGTEAGTFMIHDVRPGSGGSNPRDFTQAGSNLYFAADDGVNGTELWKTGAPVAIDDRGDEGHFTLFPNPATERFFVLAPDASVAMHVTVYDITGREVYNSIANGGAEVFTGNWIPGLYHVMIADGSRIVCEKVLVR